MPPVSPSAQEQVSRLESCPRLPLSLGPRKQGRPKLRSSPCPSLQRQEQAGLCTLDIRGRSCSRSPPVGCTVQDPSSGESARDDARLVRQTSRRNFQNDYVV